MSAALWETIAAAIPADLEGKRVFDLAPAGDPDPVSEGLESRGPALLVRGAPDEEWGAESGFDLVVCRDVLQRDAHPARLINRIWEVMVEGATLVLQSPVMTEPEKSRFARFVAASAGVGTSEWLPGRLALRWTVETNGFDVERFLATEDRPRAGVADAALLATRTGRYPSLVLATPHPPKEGSDGRG